MPESQWASGPAFAEVAEVLGVRTDQIMAAGNFEGRFLVLYTPTTEFDQKVDADSDIPVFRAIMERDDERILRLLGEPQEVPGMWRELVAQLEEQSDA